MRGSKAKRLRRIAEEITVGRPALKYISHPVKGNTMVAPGTTRGVYLAAKDAVRRGIRRGEQ